MFQLENTLDKYKLSKREDKLDLILALRCFQIAKAYLRNLHQVRCLATQMTKLYTSRVQELPTIHIEWLAARNV